MSLVPKLIYSLNRLHWRITSPLTVGVRLLLIRDDTVLLVKHTYVPNWYLVGGKVEKNETVEQAARREAREEVGAELGELRLFGLYSNFIERRSDHIAVFTCSDFTVSGKTDREIECFKVFRLNDLPGDISPATKRRIREYTNGSAKPAVSVW